jgi:hypothetical protein
MDLIKVAPKLMPTYLLTFPEKRLSSHATKRGEGEVQCLK